MRLIGDRLAVIGAAESWVAARFNADRKTVGVGLSAVSSDDTWLVIGLSIRKPDETLAETCPKRKCVVEKACLAQSD
jgi:hypothetical protein